MIGDDGGCFLHAYLTVLKNGGVLEHPAKTIAWRQFGIVKPVRGKWIRDETGGWVTEVSQSAYGHRAQKRTWLFAVAPTLPELDWSDPKGTHQVGWFDRNKPPLGKREASLSPLAFVQVLIQIAESNL